jgi:S-adenosylmethionine:tRNA ribosyltransferase-isomerase
MTTDLDPVSRTTFELPDSLAATEPPEARGLSRDGVRMLVAGPDRLEHARFRDIGRYLSPGDLLVVNTSSTRPAAIEGLRPNHEPLVVHFSTELDDGSWVVEFRTSDETKVMSGMQPDETILLPADTRLYVLEPYPSPATGADPRLWRVRLDRAVEPYLARYGRPIAYGYVHGRWPLSAYQTIFARRHASAEMPSAARPFTHKLVTELVTDGINIAPIVLHCGVSSLEAGEVPQNERFLVPPATAWLVNETHRVGGRVIAVGTTAVRALETLAAQDGTVSPGKGWTSLVMGPGRPSRTVDGLVTGWHAPGASHLALLEAVAGPRLVQTAYDAALAAGYLWHEFGDSCLLLPYDLESRSRQRSLAEPFNLL